MKSVWCSSFAVAAAILTFSACKTQHDCKTGTALIEITCEMSPAESDELVMSVSDERGSEMRIFGSCVDKPTLQVNLSQYAANSKLNASVTFRSGGQALSAPINREITLADGCTKYAFTIAVTDVVLINPNIDGGAGGTGGVGPAGGTGGDVDSDGSVDGMPMAGAGGNGGMGGNAPEPAGLGSACSSSDDCATGAFCVSKICCNAKCEGSCESCSATDTGETNGFCKAVKAGSDPKTACGKQASNACGPAGSCDGQGACTLAAPGTSCGPSMCGSPGQVVGASSCNGKGQCVAGISSGCGGFACKAGSCSDSCSGDSECVGVKCINGKCGGKRGLGEACSGGDECGSGNCAQSVCCDSACGEACKSCKASETGKANGTCSFVKAGEDPRNSCTESANGSCGNDGMCDGAGGCRKQNASTVCGAATCSGSTYSAARTCDGAGECKTATTANCDVYACTVGGCKKPCGGDGDCVANYFCSNGTCTPKKAAGGTCSAGNQCSTGFCAPEGVCCNEACNGTCRQCAAGTCGNVAGKQDPGTCDGEKTCNASAICLGKMGAKCATKADCDYPFCDEFYPDADGDNDGDRSKAQRFCLANQGPNFHDTPPPGYIIYGGDCCDRDPKANTQFNIGVDAEGNYKESNYGDAATMCGTWDWNCDGTEQIKAALCCNGQPCPDTPTVMGSRTCFDYTAAPGCGMPGLYKTWIYSMLYTSAAVQTCR